MVCCYSPVLKNSLDGRLFGGENGADVVLDGAGLKSFVHKDVRPVAPLLLGFCFRELGQSFHHAFVCGLSPS